MSIDATFTAGEEKEFYAPGDFFRLLDSTSPVTLRFYDKGKEVAVAESVEQGYAERFREGLFDRIRIDSALGQTIKFVTRLGNEVQYDKPPTGDVNVLNVNGAFVSYQKTVDTPSGSILTGNPLRRYLLIQNNDAAIDIWINLEGFTAGPNINGSIRIRADGGWIELKGYSNTNNIDAWAAATNANVAVVEG